MAGSIGNLYRSIGYLSSTYVQPGLDKNTLLNPKVPYLPFGQGTRPLLLLQNAQKTPKFYTCSSCDYGLYGTQDHGYVTDERGVACPRCKNAMTAEKTYVANNAAGSSSVVNGGFVKGLVTYTVMDDLVVKPMSTISSIALFNEFKVKDVGDVEERVVQVGMNEGLAILEASFKSNTVLTDTFLGNEVKKACFFPS
ncbi:hypothetical protein MRB53_009804 [Persea americana]|uniref:Uncharacterized protein n=1 Tax=Persea americana TaxID=3435 RepID=A0ACC2LR28_PERAE|nr:hypothetical protein MRB53_009804 [Persea americana]